MLRTFRHKGSTELNVYLIHASKRFHSCLRAKNVCFNTIFSLETLNMISENGTVLNQFNATLLSFHFNIKTLRHQQKVNWNKMLVVCNRISTQIFSQIYFDCFVSLEAWKLSHASGMCYINENLKFSSPSWISLHNLTTFEDDLKKNLRICVCTNVKHSFNQDKYFVGNAIRSENSKLLDASAETFLSFVSNFLAVRCRS